MPYFYYQSKKLYYTEIGEGEPLLLLHENTASSKMFEPLLPLYTDRFKVILLDFLGNGRSQRVERLPDELWVDWGRQAAALIDHLGYETVSVAGCSGGAWAAMNAGLLRPERIGKVVADSFDGRTLAGNFAERLLKERAEAKQDENSAGFYQWCQGEDWEAVVDQDTEALVRCAEKRVPLFAKPLTEWRLPLLLMGSLGDGMTREDIQKEYEAIAAETGGEICLFPDGTHPSLYSNAEKAAAVIGRFLGGKEKPAGTE